MAIHTQVMKRVRTPARGKLTASTLTRESLASLQALHAQFNERLGHKMPLYVFTGLLVEFGADNLDTLARYYAERITARTGGINTA